MQSLAPAPGGGRGVGRKHREHAKRRVSRLWLLPSLSPRPDERRARPVGLSWGIEGLQAGVTERARAAQPPARRAGAAACKGVARPRPHEKRPERPGGSAGSPGGHRRSMEPKPTGAMRGHDKPGLPTTPQPPARFRLSTKAFVDSLRGPPLLLHRGQRRRVKRLGIWWISLAPRGTPRRRKKISPHKAG